MPAISQDQAGTAADKGPGIVIVTGASSGLGREFAGQLARDYPAFCGELWLLARRESRLQQLQAQLQPLCPCRILVLDLLMESAWQKLAQELAQAARPVCGLVNAAGIGRPGHFAGQSEAFQLQLLRLDAEVPVRLCHLVLPYLKTGARIWNIASVSAGSADLDSSPETASSSPEAAGYAPSGEDQSIESLAGDFPIIYSLNHLGEVRVTVLDREVLLTYVSPPDGQAEPDFTGISRYVSKEVDDPSGALTLVLTPASYWEMLSALQDEINQQYNQLIERGLTPASWLSLDTELDIGEIYITVDPETFAAADKYDVPAIQTLASLYQLYDGVQPDSIQVTLVFQSQEDGSVLDVMDSALEQEPETETASVAKGSVPASALVQP